MAPSTDPTVEFFDELASMGHVPLLHSTSGTIRIDLDDSGDTTHWYITIDKGEGIFGRFRTMAISRAAVLTGAVVGSVVRTLSGIAIVFAVALLLGFRTTAGPVQCL
jgi:ABC-2 type transport system permease protein